MSVDERLRIGLSRNAESLDPDVELCLETALARRRRSSQFRWAGAAAGLVAAACAIGVLGSPGGWGSWGRPLVPGQHAPSSVALQGRYAGEAASITGAPSVEGRWVLEFKAQGVLTVTAPPAYPGVVSGVLYALDGDELRTDLFSQDLCSGQPLGQYTVTRVGAELTLSVVDDTCPQRVAVLSTTNWTATS
jgi:hypothetical protein